MYLVLEKPYLKKLKNILQCNYIFYILLILSVLYVFINISYIDSKSKYTGKETKIYGYITDYKIDGDKLTITLKSKEKLIVNYLEKDFTFTQFFDIT